MDWLVKTQSAELGKKRIVFNAEVAKSAEMGPVVSSEAPLRSDLRDLRVLRVSTWKGIFPDPNSLQSQSFDKEVTEVRPEGTEDLETLDLNSVSRLVSAVAVTKTEAPCSVQLRVTSATSVSKNSE
jgi:hypothetical protein